MCVQNLGVRTWVERTRHGSGDSSGCRCRAAGQQLTVEPGQLQSILDVVGHFCIADALPDQMISDKTSNLLTLTLGSHCKQLLVEIAPGVQTFVPAPAVNSLMLRPTS